MSQVFCSKCLAPIEHTGKVTKHKRRCKACKAAYNDAWRKANPEKWKAFPSVAKPQKYDPEAQRRLYEARRADPEKRAKMKARQDLRNAITDGRIRRLPCEVCGNEKTEAHHEDYSKPFEVRWLCPPHHREIHKRQAGPVNIHLSTGEGTE